MKTVTFYSYKGGVGRTLALANIAMRLSEFGSKVCIIDFDLEAPGVHYKFPRVDLHNRKGIVNYIYEYVETKERPENLTELVITLPPTVRDGEPIQLIPAGDIHSPNYWSNLSKINWSDLLYKEDGILFLLDLKERIKNELNPDFLLIDSRTGITEIAGITISLLADHVTLLAVNNPENIFGCKQLLNSIRNPSENILNKTIQSTFVLTRIPVLSIDPDLDYAKHGALLKKVSVQIFDDAERYKEILIIHSDDELLLEESLKINAPVKDSKTANKITKKNISFDSPITQDYLNLFEMLTQGYLSEQKEINLKRFKKASSLLYKIYSINDYKEKLILLDQVLFLNEKFAEAYFWRGYIYSEQEDFEKTILAYNKAIEIKPDYYVAWFNRGVAYDNLEQYDQAILDYSKAIELKPDDPDAWCNRAIAYANQNKYEQTVADYSKAIELKPDDPDALYNRAIAYQSLNRFEEAINDCSNAIILKPDYHKAYHNRGSVYSNLNQYEQAILDYSKAIELKPEDSNVYVSRGTSYFYTGKFQESINDFDKAIKISPSARAYNNRGFLFGILGEYSKSIDDLKKSIELDNEFDYAHGNLAQILFILGQKAEAKKELEIAFSLKPEDNSPILCSLWFQVYAHLPERITEAKKELENLLESGSKAIGWDFSKNIEVAIANGHPEPESLREFARKITEK